MLLQYIITSTGKAICGIIIAEIVPNVDNKIIVFRMIPSWRQTVAMDI